MARVFAPPAPGRCSTADAAIALSARTSNTSHTAVIEMFRSSWFM
jgi:hypothetical protein